jgi:hypothetical protein
VHRPGQSRHDLLRHRQQPDNNHYGNYTEPSWANGDWKPIVFPWLYVQAGLRFRPFHQFMMRVEAG